MSASYSEEQAILAVNRLSATRLRAFLRAEHVIPTHTPDGPVFTEADLARMELLCELSEDFELDEDALGVVISLVDQLHGVRRQLRALACAVEDQSPEVRERVRDAYLRAVDR